MTRRRTLSQEIRTTGTALHAGVPVTMILSPARSGQGIVFRRADLGVEIPARYDQVSETRLGTSFLSAATVAMVILAPSILQLVLFRNRFDLALAR